MMRRAMILMKTTYTVVAFATATIVANAFLTSTIVAQKKTPGFNNKIPESILTPDEMKAQIGPLKFFDGIPSTETAALLCYFAGLAVSDVVRTSAVGRKTPS